MALAATFTANFDSFNRALDDAAGRLKTFEPAVGNVDRALQNMTKGFSGTTVIRDAEAMAKAIEAVGGVATLTEKEQARVNATVREAIEKYDRLGKEVPPHLTTLANQTASVKEHSDKWNLSMATVASTVGNFVSNALTGALSGIGRFIEDAIELGGKLTDLSNKTGLSTTALQGMKFAAEQTGGNIDTVSNAVGKMSDLLASGDKSAIGALGRLGLSFADIRAMSPEEAFYTITDAIGKVKDPMERARSATDLFGKAGRDLLPTITDASGGFRALADNAKALGLVIDADMVGNLDAMGDAWDRIKGTITSGLINELGPFAALIVAIADAAGAAAPNIQAVGTNAATTAQQERELWEQTQAYREEQEETNKAIETAIGAANPLASAYYSLRDASQSASTWIAALSLDISKVPAVVGPATAAVEAMRKQMREDENSRSFAAQMLDGEAALALLNEQLKTTKDDHEKAAAAAKKLADEQSKLTGADVLRAAADMAANIKAIGGASEITASQVAPVNKLFTDAIRIATEQGTQVPQWWLDIAKATFDATGELNNYVTGIPKIGRAYTEVVPPPFLTSAKVDAQITAAMSNVPVVVSQGMTNAVATVPAIWGEATAKGMKEAAKEVDAQAPSIGASFRAGFGDMRSFGAEIGKAVLDAATGGGDPGKAIGSLVGQKVGASLNNAFQGMFESDGPLAGIAETGFGKVLSGAASAVLPGVGALLGQGVGALFDKVFKKEEMKVNDLRDAFITQAGGLHELNVKATEAGTTLNELLKAKKTEDFEKAIGNLEGAMKKFNERVTTLGTDLSTTLSTGTLLTRDLMTEIGKLSQNDQAKQSIIGFMVGEIKMVTDGLNTAVGPWVSKIDEVRKAAEKAGGPDGLQMLKAAAVANKEEFDRLGIIAVGAFNAARDAGMTVPQAFAAIQPGLTAMGDAAKALGLNAGGAFGDMLKFADLSTTFGPLLTSMAGLNDIMVGMSNIGLLDPATFTAISDQVGAAFRTMTSNGASAEEAMRLLQPQLQTMWQLQKDFGLEVSDSTKQLIDQATEAGITGGKYQTSQQQMTDALNAFISRLDVMLGALGLKVPEAARAGADGMVSAIGKGADDSSRELNEIYDKSNWLFTGAVPALAQQGAGQMIGQIGWGAEGAIAQLNRVGDGADYALKGRLPSAATVGVTGINNAFKAIDVGGVQDAVHDIDWEFERGIPDATKTGVALVNTQMDNAEVAIGDVDRKAEQVSQTVGVDVPESSATAARAIDNLRASGVADLNEIERAIHGILFGHSPGGFKDIPILTRQGAVAITDLARTSLPQLRAIERAATDAALGKSDAGIQAVEAQTWLSADALSELGDIGPDQFAQIEEAADDTAAAIGDVGVRAALVATQMVQSFTAAAGLVNSLKIAPSVSAGSGAAMTAAAGGGSMTPVLGSAATGVTGRGVGSPADVMALIEAAYAKGSLPTPGTTALQVVTPEFSRQVPNSALTAVIDWYTGRAIDPYQTEFGSRTSWSPQAFAAAYDLNRQAPLVSNATVTEPTLSATPTQITTQVYLDTRLIAEAVAEQLPYVN